MKFNVSRSRDLRLDSADESKDQILPKKGSAKKLERESMLHNFPLFTNSISQPNIFSILNINYNKCKDNNIITIKNKNSYSSQASGHQIPKTSIPSRNFKDLLNANLLNKKKQNNFFQGGSTNNKAAVFDNKKAKPMKRNFSQKSDISKSKNSGDWRYSSKLEIPKTGKSITREANSKSKSRVSSNAKVDRSANSNMPRFKSDKSFVPFARSSMNTESPQMLIDMELLASISAFKRKFGCFLKSFPS